MTWANSGTLSSTGLNVVWSAPGPPCNAMTVGRSIIAGPSGTRPQPSTSKYTEMSPSDTRMASRSHARRSVPVLVLQQPLVQLARRMTREFGAEVDRARALVVRQAFATVVDELPLQRGPRLIGVHRLYDRLDRLPHLRVRHPDHGHVGDLGMDGEEVLGLLRIDVHATTDDHVREAVGEEQEAVLVHVPDVAERGPAAAERVAAGGRLGRVVVVLELRPTGEVQGPGTPGRQLGALLVAHVDLPDERPADRARMLQPGRGVGVDEAVAL